MDRVARLFAAERNALFSESAARKGTTLAVIEKDFWVTWVLARLFGQAELARPAALRQLEAQINGGGA